MLDRQNLVQLMKTVAKADPSAPTAYSFGGQSLSYDALNETLRRELNELAGTYALYRENKNTIFSIIEEIAKLQVSAMEELTNKYPLVADTARSIHTSEDTPFNTSYETYLRGELSTYSDKTLQLYGRYLVDLLSKEINPAMLIMDNTAKLYGYSSLEELEERLKNAQE